MRSVVLQLVVLALVVALASAEAQENQAIKVTPVVTNLYNPCGIAIQPETGDIYIADSGALRILRYSPKERVVEEAIIGSPKDVYGKGPMYDIGPLGLLFLDKTTLVVGDGGLPDGQEVLRFFEVPKPGEHITYDKMKHQLGPIEASEQTAKGEGNFYGLARIGDSIFITTNGDDTKGWVARATLKDGVPQKLELAIATKEKTDVNAPVAATVTPDGKKLVIGQMGAVNVPGDSLLTMYDPDSGELIFRAQPEPALSDIAALAYSPKSGKLYAVDFAWAEPENGGLFRLDIETTEGEAPKVTAVKLHALDKPTAMAFDAEGVLYVLEFGTEKEGDTKKPGRLLKITGDL